MAVTPNLGITHVNATDADKPAVVNAALQLFDDAFCESLTIDLSATSPFTSSLTLTAAEENQNLVLILTGALSSNFTITLTGNARFLIIINQTVSSPAINLIFTVGSGSQTVSISDLAAHVLYSDGAAKVYKVS